MQIETRGGGVLDVDVTNNSVHEYYVQGMTFQAGVGTMSGGAMNLLVSGNVISDPGEHTDWNGLPVHGMEFVSGNVAGDTQQLCLDLGTNSITGSHTPNGTGVDLRLRQRFDTRFKLLGYAGSQYDTTAVENSPSARWAETDRRRRDVQHGARLRRRGVLPVRAHG